MTSEVETMNLTAPLGASRTLMVQLGQRIREVRQGSGMTQEELATALSVRVGMPISRSTIGNYETGRRPLPADLLLQIAVTCGVPLQTFALNESHAMDQGAPPSGAFQDDQPPSVTPMAGGTSTQALTLITTTLQERPDVIPFVLELIAGLVEESPLP